MIGPQKLCMALGCDRLAEQGAHVWLHGDRRFYYIAAFCRRCNHRHADEEICYCRYVARGENPGTWIPIRDTFLLKRGSERPGTAFEPFRAWCAESGPAEGHGFRERCSRYCSAGVRTG